MAMFIVPTASVLYSCRTMSVDDGLVVLEISRMVSGTVRSMFSHVVTVPLIWDAAHMASGPHGRRCVPGRCVLHPLASAARVDNIPAGEIVMSTETVAL